MKRSAGLLALVLVFALAPVPSRAATVDVFMSNIAFCNDPVCLDNENTTVKKNDIVRWNYVDAQCAALTAIGCHHTVSIGTTHSPDLGLTRRVFERQFTSTGTVAYYCRVHPAMRASIIVTS